MEDNPLVAVHSGQSKTFGVRHIHLQEPGKRRNKGCGLQRGDRSSRQLEFSASTVIIENGGKKTTSKRRELCCSIGTRLADAQCGLGDGLVPRHAPIVLRQIGRLCELLRLCFVL